jgi:hypothetical protein
VDLSAFRRFDDVWIDSAADLILANMTDVVAARLQGTAASHALLASSRVLRRFLMYTDVHYSPIPAMALFSATAACRKLGRVSELRGLHTMEAVSLDPIDCNDTPIGMHCPADRGSQKTDVAVVIPSFKRDYMRQLVAGLSEQTHRPTQIFILQNAMHVLLDFKGILNVASIPIRHVWFTNWNSFFFVTYVLMSFVPERFVLKIDDDQIPTDKSSLARFVNAAVRGDVFVGAGGAAIAHPFCGIRPQIARHFSGLSHLAWVVLFDAQAGKVLHRFGTYSFVGGEDISLSVTNAMECGTRMVEVRFPVLSYMGDGKGQRTDPEIAEGHQHFPGSLFELTYCHYIMAGYRPVTWRNFTISTLTDIRWPID